MRCRWVVAFVALAAVGSSNSSATRTPSAALKTRTLAVVRGHVDALAQDGPRVAWLFSDGACGRRVVLLDLRQRKRLSLEQRHGPSCSFGNAPLEDVVAIGGRRVVWETSIGTGNTESTGRVVT